MKVLAWCLYTLKGYQKNSFKYIYPIGIKKIGENFKIDT